MKTTGVALVLLLLYTINAAAHKLPGSSDTLDAVLDKEAQRVGLEAVQVGHLLRAIAHGLRDSAQRLEDADSQGDQYFLDKIFNAMKEVVKGAANVVQEVGKGIGNAVDAITFSDTKEPVKKAADILQKLVVKDLSLYAIEDGKLYRDFQQHIAENLFRVAESLIEKGRALCSCNGRAYLDENEAKFVQRVVQAF
ncbi:hypothetical protein HPB50_000103 [Hyalomma asiaticum]|uniref:Uncharacterized protein n=1 Tax=Hyalomma asiaticum TaxID=266040 RepID=A0ACB7STZ6_HYAAI|nr:hypothetical protein HPB50_000103 [Hyalomma asiaticum]